MPATMALTFHFEVRQVEPVHGCGKLVGLVVVAMDMAGVELVLQGVQVIRTRGGGIEVQASQVIDFERNEVMPNSHSAENPRG